MTVKIEHQLELQRPVEEVFDYLTTPENVTIWQSGVLEAERVDEGPIGQGSRVRRVTKLLGRRLKTEYAYTAYEPPRRFTMKSESRPVPYEVTVLLQPTDGGTRLQVTGHAEPGGFFRLAEPILRRAFNSGFGGDLQTLKTLLEAQAQSETAGS